MLCQMKPFLNFINIPKNGNFFFIANCCNALVKSSNVFVFFLFDVILNFICLLSFLSTKESKYLLATEIIQLFCIVPTFYEHLFLHDGKPNPNNTFYTLLSLRPCWLIILSLTLGLIELLKIGVDEPRIFEALQNFINDNLSQKVILKFLFPIFCFPFIFKFTFRIYHYLNITVLLFKFYISYFSFSNFCHFSLFVFHSLPINQLTIFKIFYFPLLIFHNSSFF